MAPSTGMATREMLSVMNQPSAPFLLSELQFLIFTFSCKSFYPAATRTKQGQDRQQSSSFPLNIQHISFRASSRHCTHVPTDPTVPSERDPEGSELPTHPERTRGRAARNTAAVARSLATSRLGGTNFKFLDRTPLPHQVELGLREQLPADLLRASTRTPSRAAAVARALATDWLGGASGYVLGEEVPAEL